MHESTWNALPNLSVNPLRAGAAAFAIAVMACAPSKPTAAAGDASAATSGTPCAQEIALECPAGEIDGCLTQPARSTVHECVQK